MTLVLGYHHPLAIVKRYGTLDHVSGGRVILGVGVGSLKEEFDLLGAPFEDRGARGDDALRALRAALQATSRPTGRVLFVWRAYGGSHARCRAYADLGRRPHQTFAATGGNASRRLVSVLRSDRDRGRVAAKLDVPPGFEVVMPADKPLDPWRTRGDKGSVGGLAAGGTTTLSAGSSITRSSTTSSRSPPSRKSTMSSKGRAHDEARYCRRTADEWGDDEYAAVGVLFGIPGDEVRARFGAPAGSATLRHPRCAGASPDMARVFLSYNAFLLQAR